MRTTESAGGVVLNPRGEVLVVSQHGNSWSLPKGHLDAGEDALTAARREIYEESGIRDLEFLRELGTYERFRIGLGRPEDRSNKKRIQLFLFRTKTMDLKPVDPDNPKARWVPRGEVAGILTHPKDKKFFLKVLKCLPQK